VRTFRRLPPLLRVAGNLGLLLPLVSLALLVQMLPTKLATSNWPADFYRVMAIATSLWMLGLSCTLVVGRYNTRFDRPGRGPFPLTSWQSQVRALALLAALPLCVLAWVVFIPPTQPGFGNVYLISMLAWVVLGGYCVWMLVRHQAVA
jgi:hypothetical protein